MGPTNYQTEAVKRLCGFFSLACLMGPLFLQILIFRQVMPTNTVVCRWPSTCTCTHSYCLQGICFEQVDTQGVADWIRYIDIMDRSGDGILRWTGFASCLWSNSSVLKATEFVVAEWNDIILKFIRPTSLMCHYYLPFFTIFFQSS